jgi:hypothetical protein
MKSKHLKRFSCSIYTSKDSGFSGILKFCTHFQDIFNTAVYDSVLRPSDLLYFHNNHRFLIPSKLESRKNTFPNLIHVFPFHTSYCLCSLMPAVGLIFKSKCSEYQRHVGIDPIFIVHGYYAYLFYL